ncbi:nadp-dependent oxidoreductase domain [Trichoderma cornu-damae]|uniref:Nadp-dependent oxidoreductase domain n=1 Tax=Trichoderma cornu-damae TaxID=654480 RepID=A0A9P8TYS0_9HYPO|nr:nadp-dependent oxidoreductase domain [Trichoderma cornu-damae]
MAHPSIGAQASRLARDLPVGISTASARIPKLVYGTAWKKDRTADLVYLALKTGFRAIDTAAQPKHYDERGVGAAVKRATGEGIIKREDLFIQTKFTSPTGQNHITPYDLDAPLASQVHQSVQSSLENFTVGGGQEAYLDSLVLHSPMDTMQETIAVWKTLETYTPHKIRHLGISNTTLPILETLCNDMTVKPAVVQNRFHNRTGYETELRAFCREQKIVFQSFWTLTANRHLIQCSPVRMVAQKAGVGAAVAYYSMVLGLEGTAILDGTTSQEHMTEDLQGIEAVGIWAEGEGASDWASALRSFRELIGESQASEH